MASEAPSGTSTALPLWCDSLLSDERGELLHSGIDKDEALWNLIRALGERSGLRTAGIAYVPFLNFPRA